MERRGLARGPRRFQLAAIGLLLPFEPDRVWWSLGTVEFRLGQVLVLIVVATAIVHALLTRRMGVPGLVLGLIVVYVGGLIISWQFAGQFTASVWATTFRLILGPLLGLAVIVLIDSRRDVTILARGLVVGAVAAAVVGLLAWSSGGDFGPTDTFRGVPTSLGPYQRLTRPFNHANVAAMYLVPCGLLMVGVGVGWLRRHWLWVMGVVLATAAIATYSRMVPIVSVLALLAVALLASRDRRRWIGAAAVVSVATMSMAVISPAWSARLAAPGLQAWYAGDIVAPAIIDDNTLSVVVTNRSTQTWRATGPDMVRLSLRWRDTAGQVQYGEDIFSLQRDLAPGDTLTMEVRTRALGSLPGGEVLGLWDLLRSREAYFQEVLGDETTSLTSEGTVDPLAVAGLPVRRPVPEVSRTDLWRAALHLVADRPLTGVGPGNFRLLYGPEIGLTSFPRGSHAHSLYLESLASSGPLVAGALVVMLMTFGFDAIRRRATLTGLESGIAGAVLAMGLHGLVDWPLIFTSTGGLFWLLLGLWVASRASPVATSG